MGKQFDQIDATQQAFIEEQHIFFVGSAATEGQVNISPKGMDCLRVLGPNRILWRNLTGSGNETAGHLIDTPRMTLMWCSFTTRPMIMRAYGTAKVYHSTDAAWDEMNAHFAPHHAARQVFDMKVDLLQTSCGYAVPFFEHKAPRDTLEHWASQRSEEDIREYWRTRNAETIDGQPTGIPQ